MIEVIRIFVFIPISEENKKEIHTFKLQRAKTVVRIYMFCPLKNKKMGSLSLAKLGAKLKDVSIVRADLTINPQT